MFFIISFIEYTIPPIIKIYHKKYKYTHIYIFM